MKKIVHTFALLLTISFQINAQWFWQNPLPQGNTLNNIDIVNDHTAYSVGIRGTILKTIDGGESWETKKLNLLTDLNGVTFISENEGWVCGDTIILCTSDGGSSWITQTTGVQTNLVDILFTNSQIGIAIGYGTILKTTNGGYTWRRIQTSFPVEQLNNITFVNDSVGWVVGSSRIIKTVDGGETWTEQYFDPYITFREVDFIDETHGWVIDPYIPNGRLLKTSDGGDNWEEKLFNTAPYVINDFILLDQNNGLFGCSLFPYKGSIVRTTDGGDTWSAVFDSVSNSLYSVDKFENSILSVGYRGVIIKSGNQGIEWFYKSSAIDLMYVWDANIINENYGWLLADWQKIFKTTNGGNDWTLVCYLQDHRIMKIQFVDSLIGWAVGDSGIILKTTDGGYNWIDQSIDSISYYQEMYFINNEIGWLYCYGNLIRTIDGGNNWELRHTWYLGTSIGSIFFLNEDDGWIAWYDRILKTTDGGLTWDSLYSPSQSGINSVKFLNQNIGWAVGNEIYKTTDGGQSWLEQRGYSSDDLFHIAIIDSNHIWAAGEKGSLYYTNDGGTNWYLQNANTSSTIINLSIVNNTTVWIVGWAGAILKTTNGGVTFIEDEENNFTQPKEFLLQQNYPNPFNPSTVISYQLPVSGEVTLKVYDVLGREVAVLIDEYRNSGSYEVDFNAAGLTSGVYFYKLTTDNYTETKKMMLIR